MEDNKENPTPVEGEKQEEELANHEINSQERMNEPLIEKPTIDNRENNDIQNNQEQYPTLEQTNDQPPAISADEPLLSKVQENFPNQPQIIPNQPIINSGVPGIQPVYPLYPQMNPSQNMEPVNGQIQVIPQSNAVPIAQPVILQQQNPQPQPVVTNQVAPVQYNSDYLKKLPGIIICPYCQKQGKTIVTKRFSCLLCCCCICFPIPYCCYTMCVDECCKCDVYSHKCPYCGAEVITYYPCCC